MREVSGERAGMWLLVRCDGAGRSRHFASLLVYGDAAGGDVNEGLDSLPGVPRYDPLRFWLRIC